MTPDEMRKFQELRSEVNTLRDEVNTLREFVKGLYAMMNEGEEYEGLPNFLGGAEYGRTNT